MPGWFTKSKQSRASSHSVEPQPYEVRCGCGQALSGIRQPQHQVAICDECGRPALVLPADAYPPIGPSKSRTKKKRKRAVPVAAVEIPESNFVEPSAQVAPSQPEQVEEEAKPIPAVLASHQVRTRFVTPFRLVIVLSVVIVSLTAWWGLHVRSLDKAARTLQSERKAGDDALSQGEMAAAAVHFRLACDATQVLGRTDATALQTCQLARETEAGANLAVHPLMEIIERAHKTLSAAKSDEERVAAEAHALDLYFGQWIVMETNLVAIDGGKGEPPRPLLEYPFTIGESRVEIDAELPALLPLKSDTGTQRVILAAQLKRCWLNEGVLVLEFVPQSAFLWQNANTLKMIGLLSGDSEQDAATLAILDRQARTVRPAP